MVEMFAILSLIISILIIDNLNKEFHFKCSVTKGAFQMRGMEKIKSKILEDSKRTVSHILEQAQQQAEKIKNDALKESESIRVEILDKAEAEGKEAYRRMVSTAVLEGRKELLKAKQDIIETAFISAMEKLLRLSDRDYQKLIEDMIVDAAKNEKGEILLAEQSKRLNEDFLKDQYKDCLR